MQCRDGHTILKPVVHSSPSPDYAPDFHSKQLEFLYRNFGQNWDFHEVSEYFQNFIYDAYCQSYPELPPQPDIILKP